MEEMPQVRVTDVDLELVRGGTEIALHDQPRKPRLFLGLAQRRRFQRLPHFDAAARNLNARIRKIRLPTYQQPPVIGDVAQRFGDVLPASHRSIRSRAILCPFGYWREPGSRA